MQISLEGCCMVKWLTRLTSKFVRQQVQIPHKTRLIPRRPNFQSMSPDSYYLILVIYAIFSLKVCMVKWLTRLISKFVRQPVQIPQKKND